MDWNDIASQSLPTLSTGATGTTATNTALSGSNDSISLSLVSSSTNKNDPQAFSFQNRNLSELRVASQALLHQQQPQQQQQFQQRNSSLGTSSTSARAQNLLGSLNRDRRWMGTSYTPRQREQQEPPPRWERFEDRLARSEQGIVDTILQKVGDQTRQGTDELIEQQLQKAWEQDRDKHIQELVGIRNVRNALPVEPLQISALALNQRNQVMQSGNYGLLSAHQRNSRGAGAVGATLAKPSLSFLDPRQVRAHLSALKDMEASKPTAAVECFKRITASFGDPGQVGYRSAMELLSRIVQTSSPSPVEQVQAALIHYCKLFRSVVVNRVREATVAGQDVTLPQTFNNEMAVQCTVFTKLTMGLSDSPWPIIYFCLRCGDAVAALDVLLQQGQRIPHDAQKILDSMAQFQRNRSCFWECGVPRISSTDRQAVRDLMEVARKTSPADLHQIGSYVLLCANGRLPSSEIQIGFNNIEDYLTGFLWNAIVHADPVSEIMKLGEQVQNYGPRYFHDPQSAGWSYSLPLLASQQYEKALSHVAHSGGTVGLMQATHLALALTRAGIPVHDLGQEQEERSNLVDHLLVAYATEVSTDPNDGPSLTIEYLSRLPDRKQALEEVAKWIANKASSLTGTKGLDWDELLGPIDQSGMRQKGIAIIDRNFAAAEVAFILGKTADLLMGQQDNVAGAVCLLRAERYEDLLSLLNELISPPDKHDEKRQFWLNQVQVLHSLYLDKRTHVLNKLEQQGKTSLIFTSRTLKKLNDFFVCLRENRLIDAGAIADGLGLLPMSTSDIASVEAQYHGSDPLVKDAYPSLLVGYMDILHQEHRRIKSDLQRGRTIWAAGTRGYGVSRDRLNQLQNKAGLLTRFAGLVGMDGPHIDNLSRRESLMM